ncbi:hypothetical protein CSV60_14825 [Sporosarcina sp. P7]|nr:hypothetical protein CSV60_14825 [Sporosarcina sp. P7]
MDAFPRAWLEPSEKRRVCFAVFLCTLQKLRHLTRVSRRTLILRESPPYTYDQLAYSIEIKELFKKVQKKKVQEKFLILEQVLSLGQFAVYAGCFFIRFLCD